MEIQQNLEIDHKQTIEMQLAIDCKNKFVIQTIIASNQQYDE